MKMTLFFNLLYLLLGFILGQFFSIEIVEEDDDEEEDKYETIEEDPKKQNKKKS